MILAEILSVLMQSTPKRKTKSHQIFPRLLAMTELKQAYICSSGLTKTMRSKGCLSHQVGQFLVEFSIVSRYYLDRRSLLFRSFFACSSFGPRSVFDRLTNDERKTNERRTRDERETNDNRSGVYRCPMVLLL